MSKRSRKSNRVGLCLRHVATTVAAVAGYVLQHLPRWRRIPIEIVLADHNRRRGLKRELAHSVRRLQKILGDLLPTDIVVVVQQVIPAEGQLAGCCQIGQRKDQHQFALVRLALQVNGKRLSTDEMLAALAEQLIGLAMKEAEGFQFRVPVRIEPTAQANETRTTFRPDPLAPRSGESGPESQAA